ncbi:hypothetical protein WL22_27655 [Burkholderia ubonensis]|nr:hypothetical protein WL22_27655 [Burkholderia ubonensis]
MRAAVGLDQPMLADRLLQLATPFLQARYGYGVSLTLGGQRVAAFRQLGANRLELDLRGRDRLPRSLGIGHRLVPCDFRFVRLMTRLGAQGR